MNDEFSPEAREEFEARLTALLLGELTGAEAASLREAIEADPRLAALYARLQKTIALVRQASATPAQPVTQTAPLKLSEEKRQTLLAQFKTIQPKEFAAPKKPSRNVRLLEIAAVFALMAVLAGLLLPALAKSKSKAISVANRNHLKQIELAKQMRAGENQKSTADAHNTLPQQPLSGQSTITFAPNQANGGGGDRRQQQIYLPPTTPQNVDRQIAAVTDLPAPNVQIKAKFADVTQMPSQPAPAAPAEKDKNLLAQRAFGAPGMSGNATITPPLALSANPTSTLVNGELAWGDKLNDSARRSPSSNPFVSSYGYIATNAPLDLDYIHNQVPQLSAGGAPTAEPRLGELGVSNDKPRSDLFSQIPLPPPPVPLPAAVTAMPSSETSIEGRSSLTVSGTTVLPSAPNQNSTIKHRTQLQSNGINYAQGTDVQDTLKSLGMAPTGQLYAEKKQELEALKKKRDLAQLKTFSEGVDFKMLKSTMSPEVVEHADAGTETSTSLGEKIGTFFTGKVERRARVKLESDVNDMASRNKNSSSLQIYDPYFVQSEFEVIQSEKVLNQVIEKLRLTETWANKNGNKLTVPETRALLRRRLDLKPDKNPNLLDIGVKASTPQEAADIANAVAAAYTEYAADQRAKLKLGGVEQFQKEKSQLDSEVQQKEKQLAELSKKMGLTEAESLGLNSATKQKIATPNQTDAPLPKTAVPAPVPQPEVFTTSNAFSTFSLNIADVSFKLAAASLEKGVLPEPASIRSEEFINAFDYRDPEAPAGVPIAFAWERARYPFAQNRDLLRFSLKTAATGRAAGRPLNLVLLLDNSGSMERADRVQIIREALRVLAGQLQPQDTLSIVTFARTPRLFVDGAPGNQAADAVEKVSDLTPQGGTNLEDAMKLAYETALRHYQASGVNRVVLLTDGAANLGNVDPAALKQNVEAHRKQGVALDCFGIGWEGYNDDLLEVLARNGDGRYGFLNSVEDATTGFAHQLAGALNVAAADVKVQVEFNPRRVTVYRQVGYAKLQLTKEQFRDNSVDAAEIGAAEAGNALYVLQVDPNGQGPLGTVRVRYRTPGTQEFHEHEWAVPYEGNAIPLEQAAPAMRLAATASAFSEWLANSPYAAEVTPDALLHDLSGVPETFAPDARPKKLEWMLRQAKSLSGK